MPYIPHTPKDTEEMLAAIGAPTIETLFDEIPSSLLYSGFQNIPSGINEMELLKMAQQMAAQNRNGICFIGAGSYEHHIPAAVWILRLEANFLLPIRPTKPKPVKAHCNYCMNIKP